MLGCQDWQELLELSPDSTTLHNVMKNEYRIWATKNFFNSATQKSQGLLGEQDLIM